MSRHTIADRTYHFLTVFDDETGAYLRTGVIENGRDTGVDPFMASFPHLIDVGVMGHCAHGRSGLCAKAGIGCYQSGRDISAPNMTLDDFYWIVRQCRGRVNQFALGGRGDPDLHEHFGDLLRLCRENDIVPNFTTSGFGLTAEHAALCARFCGAVAVSWYRSDYTLKAIQMLLDAGVKTNIHYVLGNNSIDEAVRRLRDQDFPKGINALIFLLHKPAGQGTRENVLTVTDPRTQAFFREIDRPHPFKVGLDACSVPGALGFCKKILPESLDTCEGGRFSCYIGPDLTMVPCSFDQNHQYEVQLGHDMPIEDAWNSEPFRRFREHLRSACPDCPQQAFCLGGCPLMPEIVLCDRPENTRNGRQL
ncbi:SPASM domain-containing protein [Pseudoflavonifractor phocaeensis]|uniref:SPASM domain-containing protein n=1 Tax=Pseudoflavonifractor phocaeensis TaxID=1870988 RepID=UPI001FAEFDCB|nr:SPASM domain-containing protein [Pseudoflavonifractor phocaeensis]